jgi:Tfp pilus assembly protein PilF
MEERDMSSMYRQFIRLFAVMILTSLGLFGCMTQPKITGPKPIPVAPLAKDGLFGAKPDLTQVDQIFALTDSQREDFERFFYSRKYSTTPANKRIYKYLQRYVKNYNYFNKTLTAQQSLSQAQGNCLSLAILTTALSKVAGVDTGYQLVESAPIFQKEGDIVISSQHVRSLLFAPKIELPEGVLQFNRAGVIIDYFPSAGSHVKRTVLETEFHAMYYRNTAADEIIHKNYDKAFWLLKEALALYPTDEHSINMMAVVHERKGLAYHADKLYKYGLKHSHDKLDLLRNYQKFLTKQNRFTEAKQIKAKLATMKNVNPFDWISLGHTAFSERKFSEAKRYYNKALKIAPYLHQGHMGVAKSEFKLGNINASKKSMLLAKKNAFELKLQDLYQTKLNALAKY